MGILKFVFYPGLGCFLGYALKDNTYEIYRRNIVRAFQEESARSSSLEASTILFSGTYDTLSEFLRNSKESRTIAKELESKSKQVKDALKDSSENKEQIINKARELKESLTQKKDQSDSKKPNTTTDQQTSKKDSGSTK